MFESINARLDSWADIRPDEPALTFLHNDSRQVYSFRELRARALGLAARLRSEWPGGGRALVACSPGSDFVVSLLGCFYAGLVAVPVHTPASAGLAGPLLQLERISADCEASLALVDASTSALGAALPEETPSLRGLTWVDVSEVREGAEGEWAAPGADALAFLQYTSGSTGRPKGVMVTHGNLAHNLRAILATFQLAEPDTPFEAVSWLPPYHDMGMIGAILVPLFGGIPTTQMSPIAFIRDPYRWMRELSGKHAMTTAPNFAYELCARRITDAQRATLDLSRWRAAFCGAEPVQAQTLATFEAAFAACGFSPRTWRPCYGLAEATLMVTCAEPGRPLTVDFDRDSLAQDLAVPAGAGAPMSTLVSCGPPARGMSVRIAGPTGDGLPAAGIGEIWVRGPSVARGYWGRPQESQQAFGAVPAGEPEGEPWLRTGDLGFLHEGQVFVTGRLKDLIIVRGRNYFPQDLESTAERTDPALRSSCCAAFTVADDTYGTERVVVVQEVQGPSRRSAAELERLAVGIRRRIADEHEIAVHTVVLTRPGAIAKTTSGKVRRGACRTAFEEGQLPVVWKHEQPGIDDGPAPAPMDGTAAGRGGFADVVAALTAILARTSGLTADDVDPKLAPAASGLDSLGLTDFGHRVHHDLGVELPIELLFQQTSLNDLARYASDILAAGPPVSGQGHAAPADGPDDEASAAGLSLLPAQEDLWSQLRQNPDHPVGVITRAARLTGSVDVAALRHAAEEVTLRHEALRMSFRTDDQGRARQYPQTAGDPCLSVVDADGWDEERVRRHIRTEMVDGFDLGRAPQLRIGLYALGDGTHVLAVVVHHLVADMWSLTVTFDELTRLYNATVRGERAALPPPASYRAYLRRHERYCAEDELDRDAEYWTRRLRDAPDPVRLPADAPDASARPESLRFQFPAEVPGIVRDLADRTGTTQYAVLLAAFKTLLHLRTGAAETVVGTPMSGRNWVETSGLVGLCANNVVLRVSFDGDPSFRQVVDRTSGAVRAAIEHQNLPFPLLSERLGDKSVDGAGKPFHISFLHQQSHLPQLADLAALALGVPNVTLALGESTAEVFPLGGEGSRFDLAMLVAPIHDSFFSTFRYDPERFGPAALTSFFEEYVRVLQIAGENADRPISGWFADAPEIPSKD